MAQDVKKRIRIVELERSDAALSKLKYRYLTSSYYDLKIDHEPAAWKIELMLKPLDKTLEKISESGLFQEFVEEPRVFVAELDGQQVGWIELGFQKWNNRMRVWTFLVKEEFRGKGIGMQLMEHAVNVAREKGARMLVLETQSCNVYAIDFYRRFGFELIGFDAAAYSNEDLEKKEVRLEFGLRIR